MSDDTTTTVETKAPKATLEQKLAEYTALQAAKATMPADEYDQKGRALRRQIRALGGSVTSLKPEKPADEAKPAKEPKAKKERKARGGARVEAELASANAQPAGSAHVDWLERVLRGETQIEGEGAVQITPLEQRSIEALESSGEYGYGIDVLSDVLPDAVIARFQDRFGYLPTWFAINRPESYDLPTPLTLLILGPAPAAEEVPTAEAPVEAEAETPDTEDAPDSDESWGDDDSDSDEE